MTNDITPAAFQRRLDALRVSKRDLARIAGHDHNTLDDFLLGRKDTRGKTLRNFFAALEQLERALLEHLLDLYPPAPPCGGLPVPSARGVGVSPMAEGAGFSAERAA